MSAVSAHVDSQAAAARLGRLALQARGAAANTVAQNTIRLWNAARQSLSQTDRSGRLLASLRYDVQDTQAGAEGRVTSDGSVPYARIAEYGGRIQIPALVPENAKALAFVYRGRLVFTEHTKAHELNIPARPYLRPALAETAPIFQADLRAALSEAVA